MSMCGCGVWCSSFYCTLSIARVRMWRFLQRSVLFYCETESANVWVFDPPRPHKTHTHTHTHTYTLFSQKTCTREMGSVQ